MPGKLGIAQGVQQHDALTMETVMPDMSKSGAHFESLLNTLRFRSEDCSRKAADLQIEAAAYREMAFDLERAMEKEAEKHSSAGEKP